MDLGILSSFPSRRAQRKSALSSDFSKLFNNVENKIKGFRCTARGKDATKAKSSFCLLIRRSITSFRRHLDCRLDYRRFPPAAPPHALAAASLCDPKASDCFSPAGEESAKLQ